MSRVYITSPALTDQHWRATVRDRSDAQRDDDMQAAIESGHMWRFDILRALDPARYATVEWLEEMIKNKASRMMSAILADSGESIPAYYRNTLAYKAAEHGDRQSLKVLFDTKMVDKDDESLQAEILRIAAEHGHERIVDDALGSGAKPADIFYYQMSGLVEAGHVNILRKLFAAGFDVKAHGEEMLSSAARSGKPAVVELIIDLGVKLDKNVQRAFDTAAEDGTRDVLLTFLKREDGSLDKNSAFLQAISYEKTGNAGILLAHGADINHDNGAALRNAVTYADSIETVRFLLQHNADANLCHGADETPLILAINRGRADITALLLAHGADHRAGNGRAVQAVRASDNKELIALVETHQLEWQDAHKARKLAEFEKHFGDGYTVDDLRLPVNARGESGLMIAAQSGVFEKLLAQAKGGALTPQDLYHPPQGVDTVYSLLNEAGTLQQFFANSLWADMAQQKKAHDMMPPRGQQKVPLASLITARHRGGLAKSGKDYNLNKPPSP